MITSAKLYFLYFWSPITSFVSCFIYLLLETVIRVTVNTPSFSFLFSSFFLSPYSKQRSIPLLLQQAWPRCMRLSTRETDTSYLASYDWIAVGWAHRDAHDWLMIWHHSLFARRKFCFNTGTWRQVNRPGCGMTSGFQVHLGDRPNCGNRPSCETHPSCESYIYAIDKIMFAVPLPIHFKPHYLKLFLALRENKPFFLPHFHKKIAIFSLSSSEKEKIFQTAWLGSLSVGKTKCRTLLYR